MPGSTITKFLYGIMAVLSTKFRALPPNQVLQPIAARWAAPAELYVRRIEGIMKKMNSRNHKLFKRFSTLFQPEPIAEPVYLT
jgi:hypothetical protein